MCAPGLGACRSDLTHAGSNASFFGVFSFAQYRIDKFEYKQYAQAHTTHAICSQSPDAWAKITPIEWRMWKRKTKMTFSDRTHLTPAVDFIHASKHAWHWRLTRHETESKTEKRTEMNRATCREKTIECRGINDYIVVVSSSADRRRRWQHPNSEMEFKCAEEK